MGKFSLFKRSRIRTAFRVHTVDDALVMYDEHRDVILQGRHYSEIAPLLNGQHTIPEIIKKLSGRVGMQQVFSTVSELQRKGYLREAEGHERDERTSFLEYKGLVRSTGVGAVAVHSIHSLGADLLRESLEANGVTVDAQADLQLVICDDYLRSELASYNREAIKKGQKWLIVKPVGTILWVGPLFVPGDTGCWACLEQRLSANRQMERYIQKRTQSSDALIVNKPTQDAGTKFGVHLTATFISEFLLSTAPPKLKGQLLTYDIRRRHIELHALVKRPQCEVCGDASLTICQPNSRPVLQETAKGFTADGGHRSVSPAQTLSQYAHHVSPILGAVSELLPAAGNQHELTPSFVAGHNFSLGLESVVFLKESMRGVSGGKGSSETQAKVSGLCEALERYSGVYWNEEYTEHGSFEEMAERGALHPNVLTGYSARQFAQRKQSNGERTYSRCTYVPEEFPEDVPIDWSPLWSLTEERDAYLPTASCFYGHPDTSQGWAVPDSNGCAAGNTLEEAILQGFMEIVERDAIAIWFYNCIQRPAVDLASFESPYVDAIQQHYESLGREIWVLDVTSDLPITTLACVSRSIDRPTEDLLVGFGSHFDPRIALLRSITEVNQFLPSVVQRQANGATNYLFTDALSLEWWTTTRLADNRYLAPDQAQAKVKLEDFVDLSTNDLANDVQECVRICRDHDLDLPLLDQTRPDIGLSVVRVVVPQLCHFWRRFGKSRLYDVPPKMNWLKNKPTEDDLNPRTIFF